MGKVNIFPIVDEGAVERHNADPAAHGGISRFNIALGNEYLWAKYSIKMVEQQGDEVTKEGSQSSWGGMSVQYADSVSYSNGKAVLNNPRTGTLLVTDIYHKYIVCSKVTGTNDVVYITSYSSSGSRYFYGYKPVSFVEELDSVMGYVNSPNADAYPPAVSDGYEYMPLGQLGAGARSVTGSYVGTGSYGANNRNTLTFDFIPKFLLVRPVEGEIDLILVINGMEMTYSAGGNNALNQKTYITWDGNTVKWYSSNADYQLNYSGTKYLYFAIG